MDLIRALGKRSERALRVYKGLHWLGGDLMGNSLRGD